MASSEITETSTVALEKLLSPEEYQSLPGPVCDKISQALRDQTDECACLLSLHQSEKQKNGDLINNLREQIDSIKTELNAASQSLVPLSEENKVMASKLEAFQEKLEQTETARRMLEKSLDEARHQRDTSQFSANALQSQVEFKDTQLVQLRADMARVQAELESAVQSKFEALVRQDEVDTRSKELDLREATLAKDKARMQKQLDMLNMELDKRNAETIELRKESNKTFLELQNKLEFRSAELTSVQEKYDRLEQVYKEQQKEANELRDKLTGQAQDEIDYRVHLEAQLNAQKNYVQAHKEALDATKAKCEDMETTVVELKSKLDDLNGKQTALEDENEDLKRELQARVDHFTEQMKAADDMLFAVKSESLNKSLETLSPYAMEISRRLREGLTYTELIKLYADATEELVVKQGIIEALQGDMARIMQELKEVAPQMRRKCDRLHEALQVIDHVTAAKEKLEHEKCLLDEAYRNEKTRAEVIGRENERNKAYVRDLCKQLCLFLKKEAEERGIPVPITDDRCPASNRRASLDLNSLVENRLLTFSCVEELQQRNLELLETVRILKEELEKSVSLSERKMEQVQAESKSDSEKQLEQLREQYETQKQHVKYLMILLRQSPGETGGIEYNEDFQSFTSRTRVSTEVQTDESTILYTVKDFHTLQAELAATKAQLESRISSLLTQEAALRTELRSAESEAAELKVKVRKLVSENEYKEEMLSTLRHNAEITGAQVTVLEKTNQSYRESIVKNEAVVSALHEQLKTTSKQLASAEVAGEQYRRDIEHLKETVRDLTSARETLARDKNMHAQLMSHIEGIKTQMQLSESVGKAKLEARLEDALKELNGLRHKLSEDASLHASKVDQLNRNLETLRTRVDEEVKAKTEARADLEVARAELKEVLTQLSAVKAELEKARSQRVSVDEKDKEVDKLRCELVKTQGELKEAQNLVAVTKANEKSMQEICATFEKHNRELTQQVKTTQAAHDAKVAELTQQVTALSASLKEKEEKLATTAGSDGVATPSGATAASSDGPDDVSSLRSELVATREALRVCEAERDKASAAYLRELQLHADDSASLPRVQAEVSALKSDLQTLRNDKAALVSKVQAYEMQLSARQDDLDAEKTRVRQELEEMKVQNETLYKALDELSSQCNQSLNELENSSELTPDQELRGNENVISVIKHLRQQCSLARMEQQSIACEVRVLRSDKEMLTRKLGESNELLTAERNKNLTNEKTHEKHAELVRKIEMMEVVSDSNRILREDRDKLRAQLAAAAKEKESAEARLVDPLRAKISSLLQDLETKNSQIEHLRKQSEQWKARADDLVERSQRANPEDLKRLSLEKETLSKQLVSERDSYRANLEELKALRAETSAQRDQLTALNKQVDDLKSASSELTKVRAELESSRAELSAMSGAKTELEAAQATLDTVQKDVTQKAQLIDSLKKLARRYKTQFEETSKALEEKDKAKTSQEEEDKSRAESHEAQLKEKDESIARAEAEKAALEAEMNSFKATFTQREERMKEVLKKCKQKMATQVLEISQLKKATGGMAVVGAPIPTLGGGSAANSPATHDLEEMERTIAELREERDKLTRDNEAMLQKNNLLTRHLSVQSSSSSESLGVKPTQEPPPTANIKPMSGGAAATVAPWRETPFASIRPMFSDARTTVVVPPTNLLEPASSSSSVAPHHLDYMSPTSSGPASLRQATILPTSQQQGLSQQGTMSRSSPVAGASVQAVSGESAESTQHEEAESPELEQQQSSSSTASAGAQAASMVALVLPQERSESQQSSQQVVTGSQANQQVVTGSQNQQVVTGSQNQQAVTGSQNQQMVTGSQVNQQLVSGSSSASLVTGSNQQDEAMAGPSQQYRQEVPSTSTNQQVNENSSNTVTTSRANVKRPRAADLADSLEAAEEDEEAGSLKRRRVLEVEYQVPTSSQRDQEDEILVPDSEEDEEEEEEEDGCVEGGEGEEEEEQEEEMEVGDVEVERHHGYEHGAEGEDYDEQGTQPHSAEPSSSQPPSYEETGDGIVPSTPTLCVPRPSPHVPSGRFTFTSDSPLGGSNISTLGATGASASGTGGPGGGGGDGLIDLTQNSDEPGTSRSVPEQVVTLASLDFDAVAPVGRDAGAGSGDAIDISESASEVSSEGDRGEEEGREAEAVAPVTGPGIPQRIPPLVSVRRGGPRGSRASRVTPIPIVWEDEGLGRGRGGFARGGRAGRRGRPFGPASSSYQQRFLP